MKYLQILFEPKIQLLFIEQRIWFIGNISYFVTQLRRNVLPPFTSSLNVTNLRAGPGRNKAPSFYKFKQPKLISEKYISFTAWPALYSIHSFPTKKFILIFEKYTKTTSVSKKWIINNIHHFSMKISTPCSAVVAIFLYV